MWILPLAYMGLPPASSTTSLRHHALYAFALVLWHYPTNPSGCKFHVIWWEYFSSHDSHLLGCYKVSSTSKSQTVTGNIGVNYSVVSHFLGICQLWPLHKTLASQGISPRVKQTLPRLLLGIFWFLGPINHSLSFGCALWTSRGPRPAMTIFSIKCQEDFLSLGVVNRNLSYKLHIWTCHDLQPSMIIWTLSNRFASRQTAHYS